MITTAAPKNTSKLLKVCIIAGIPLTERRVGGQARQMYLLSKGLRKRGYEIHYVSYCGESDEDIVFRRIKGIFHYNDLLKKSIGRLFLYKALIDANCDIYVGSADLMAVGLEGFYCSKHKKIFVFNSVHIWDSDFTFKRGTGWHYTTPWCRKIYVYGIKKANVIVCDAQYVAERFRSMKGVTSDIRVIPHGQPIPKFKDLNGKKDYILWVARGDWWKRPTLFFKLAKSLPQYRFVMVGAGTEKYRNRLQNLEVKGFVPENELRELYAKASLFVSTSIAEGYPNTLIESGIYMVPYLSFVDPDEVICKFDLGSHINNLEEAVEKIEFLMSNHEERMYLGKNIRKFVEKNHNIEKVVDGWERLINKIK